MSARLRPAVAADVPAIAACVDAAYTPYVEQIGVRPGPLDFDHGAAVRDGLVTVAVEGDEVVGLLVLRDDVVENVAVAPDQQGRGLGRLLLEHAEDRARAAGIRELHLHTHGRMTANRARYAHLGWTETDREDPEGFGRVYFRKPL